MRQQRNWLSSWITSFLLFWGTVSNGPYCNGWTHGWHPMPDATVSRRSFVVGTSVVATMGVTCMTTNTLPCQAMTNHNLAPSIMIPSHDLYSHEQTTILEVSVSSSTSTSTSTILADNSAATTTSSSSSSTSNDYFSFVPPLDCNTVSNKPLKTHLFEINCISPTTPGYQFGITVDPVRIDSLQEFGTPEQVAARIVLAEVNRDGVMDVTLMEDPISMVDSLHSQPVQQAVGVSKDNINTITYYLVNYKSQGKRGVKRFVCKICIYSKKLIVLTAQCKEEDYPVKQVDMMKSIASFHVV